MPISHRLRSSMFERPDEGQNELPKRIVFLSLEGTVTELDYFRCVQKYREELGINALIYIEPLTRDGDTSSDPESVMSLLEEFIAIQKNGILAEDILNELLQTGQHFTLSQVREYLNNQLEGKARANIEDMLRYMGVDLQYQMFLQSFQGEDKQDVFAIVIDRDSDSHTETGLRMLYQSCKEKNCECYITNPCFEFWLLLHICDVKTELSGQYQDILENKKVSNRHTFVSRELSNRANHAKHISEKIFQTYYLPNIDQAISRANGFKNNLNDLLVDLGSNLPQLFAKLRENP